MLSKDDNLQHWKGEKTTKEDRSETDKLSALSRPKESRYPLIHVIMSAMCNKNEGVLNPS